MYSHLCDRCLACAHQIIQEYPEFKEKFENPKEFKTEILDKLSLILNLCFCQKLENLNYDFLNKSCSDCINLNKYPCKKNIKTFIRIFMINKIFNLICFNEYSKELLENKGFLEKIK